MCYFYCGWLLSVRTSRRPINKPCSAVGCSVLQLLALTHLQFSRPANLTTYTILSLFSLQIELSRRFVAATARRVSHMSSFFFIFLLFFGYLQY